MTPARTEVLDLRSGPVALRVRAGGGAVGERTAQYAAPRGDPLVLLDVEALGAGACLAPEGATRSPPRS